MLFLQNKAVRRAGSTLVVLSAILSALFCLTFSCFKETKECSLVSLKQKQHIEEVDKNT